MYYTISIILILTFLFWYINKNILEKFTVTWTPYIIDKYRQPGYSNYFYHNNYMYPIY